MSEIRFHSGDPSRPPRSFSLDGPRGPLLSAGLLVAGICVAAGLFASSDLVNELVRSADRFALRETARRSQEAMGSVRRKLARLDKRVATDELFVARLASVLEQPLVTGFPSDVTPDVESGADPSPQVTLLARRLRRLEFVRRRLASATVPLPGGLDPARIPSRAPVEPASAVLLVLYGGRVSPLTRHPEFHPGLAVAAPRGAAVISPAEGNVVRAGPVPNSAGALYRTLGNVVVLAHGDRFRTVFGHLEKPAVRVGQKVRRGETVGRVGQTGFATSPQLFYGVFRLTGNRWASVDPRLYVLDVDWLTASDVRAAVVGPEEADLPPALR